MKKLLLVDNLDSFTYNLVHYLEGYGAEVTVWRNTYNGVAEAEAFDALVLSPGPGLPTEAGYLMDYIARWQAHKPMLGVCLGHQAIAEHFGAQLFNLPQVWHGLPDILTEVDGAQPIFRGLSSPIQVGRYHSWAVADAGFPEKILQVTARDSQGHIAALQHRTLPITGVQFHPESVLCPQGKMLLLAWYDSV